MQESPTLPQMESRFEALKRLNKHGVPLWKARELRVAFGYRHWESFSELIGRAIKACEDSGTPYTEHFRELPKTDGIGSDKQGYASDYWLTREVCYLIAMNGDPRKKVLIAEAQRYFAKQTIRQEEFDKLPDDHKRMITYNRAKNSEVTLDSVALQHGVVDIEAFHDAGCEGLYGGYNVFHLKRKKKIPENSHPLDFMSREELALNDVRDTQTESKITKDNIEGQEARHIKQ